MEQSYSNIISRDTSIRENGGIPYSSIEKDIMILKESLKGLKMEHMRARIQNMEQSMQIQNQFNALHTCTSRNTEYIPTNPHYAGAPGVCDMAWKPPYISWSSPILPTYFHKPGNSNNTK